MKRLLNASLALMALCSLNSNISAQSKTIEENPDFDVRITLSKLESDSKKDKYLMEVSLVNKRDYDLYYAVAKGDGDQNTRSALGSLKVHNATGLIKSTAVSGTPTRWETTNNEMLMQLGKNATLKTQFKFSVPKGNQPVVTYTGVNAPKKLEDFSLRLNAALVNGTWNSSCLTAPITLSYVDTGAVHYILQTINGRYIKWIKQTENTFARAESFGTTLSFNRSNGQFFYTNTDGIFCVWRKEE
jgi:hypothetical protein